MTELSKELEVAVAAARTAGDLLLSRLGHELEIDYKAGPVDLVTDADRESQAAVTEVLLSAFPEHALLGEEGTTGDPGADDVWVVDPLDGTTNFAHGMPMFAVSIALCRDARVVCGVVYDPSRDELFTATDGGGAACNGRPLRVSDVETLERALLVTQVQSTDPAVIGDFLRRVERLLGVAGGVRNFGCPALMLCAVAAGRLEGFCERAMKPWDVAAGGLILREAGGRTTDFENGTTDALATADLVATNGRIHDELLAVLGAEPSTTRGRAA